MAHQMPRLSTKNPGIMRASEINKELDRLDKLSSQANDQIIAAGRGREKLMEVFEKDDPLSRKAAAISNRQHDLRTEIRKRMGPDAPSRIPVWDNFWKRHGGPRIKQSSLDRG